MAENASVAAKREQIEELLTEIAFRKKRMDDVFVPQTYKAMGDDYYQLAGLYRDTNDIEACETAAREAVRYYQQICDRQETDAALWDLVFAWVMLRDLYRGGSRPEMRAKAIAAAKKCADLFLRITQISDKDVYFKNYQISCYILIRILSVGAPESLLRAYEVCTDCIRNLQRWPEDRGGMRFARIGEMYRQLAELCGGLRRREDPPQKDWLREELDAIDRADALYQRAMEISAGSADVADYILDAYDGWRRQFAQAPERERKYVKAEFECTRVLFSEKPVRHARNYFLLAWMHAEASDAVLTAPEKRALCEEMARELKAVHFYTRGENDQEETMMKCCYYLGELHKTCFPKEKREYHSRFLQSCEYGMTAIREKHTYDDSRYFPLALEELIKCDEMPYEERPAFAERAKEIFRGELFGKKQSAEMIAALDAFAMEPAAYFDPDDEDDDF